jgi:hypothetical protein
MTRKDVLKVGSPIYHIDINDIADGSFEQVDLMQDNSVYAKYAPFDFLEVYNASALRLELLLNDIHRFPIPPNVDLVKADLKFNRLRIINNSGSTLTGTDLYVSVQATPLTEDKALRSELNGNVLKKIAPYAGLAGLII